MQTLKMIGLCALFSFVGSVICVFVSIMRGGLHVETGTGHAIGWNAVVGGIMEGLPSPLTWLVLLVSFGAAFWLVRRTTRCRYAAGQEGLRREVCRRVDK